MRYWYKCPKCGKRFQKRGELIGVSYAKLNKSKKHKTRRK
jgi:hypothetical protein